VTTNLPAEPSAAPSAVESEGQGERSGGGLRPIRIGTRGSPLALAQAREVAARLTAAHGAALTFDIREIKTTGDRIQDRPLAEAGGKGLFTKEIEEALAAGTADLAVHSMKDMPTELPPGLTLAAFLPREDVRDALISARVGSRAGAASLAELPAGAVVATSSLRRQAQVRHLRPDLKVVSMRGNVETRLRKLAEGAADATLLALAGLNRLGLADRAAGPVSVEDMLPAVAQGAIGVEIRADDTAMAALLAPLNHQPTALAVAAERAFLAKLEGSCRMPIAALGELTSGPAAAPSGEPARMRFAFRGMILSPDGSQCFQARREGRPEEALRLAEDAADEVIAAAGPELLARLRGS
jgi:hydroxymethylbilane synthase